MDRIRIGVVGCGDIAFRAYLPALKAMADTVELVATCDTNKTLADKARAEYGAGESYGDAREMLAGSAIDGVLVLTSMVPHGPLSLMAMEAGKHVYVEKVMAVDMKAADRMVAAAEKRKLVLACAPSTILLSAFQHIQRIVKSGEMGRISVIQALAAHFGPARWDDYTGDPTWFYRKGAGPLFDLAVYPVQVLIHLFGPVQRVTAFSGLAVPEVVMTPRPVRGRTVTVEVDDTVPMLLEFGNGTFASVFTSYNVLSSRNPAMQFYGSRGAMTAPQFLGDDVELWHAGDKEWTSVREEKTRYDELGIAAGLPHWLECIRTGAKPVNDGRFGRHVLETLLAAQVSARTHKAVELRARE